MCLSWFSGFGEYFSHSQLLSEGFKPQGIINYQKYVVEICAINQYTDWKKKTLGIDSELKGLHG